MIAETNNSVGHFAPKFSHATFFRDSSLFSISLTLAGLCAIMRSFFLAKFLGPQAFGTWRFINLFLDYLRLASLGTQPAMTQRLPFLRGKGNTQETHIVLHTAFVTTFFTSILYSAGVFAWSYTLTDIPNSRALALFSPVLLLFAWLGFAQEFLLAAELYALRSRLEVVHAIFSLVFSVILIFFWGIFGAILALAIATSVALVTSFGHLFHYCSFTLKWKPFWDLVLTGLPMLANGMSILTMANADRIMIAIFLNTELLGIYSVSNAGLTILGMIPSAIGQMLLVKLSELYGQNKSKEYMFNFLDRAIFTFSTFFAFITSMVIAFFPPAVILLLPDYIDGIRPGTLLIMGSFFFAVSLPVTNWYMSAGRFRPVLFLRLILLSIEFIAIYVVIKTGGTLEFIALCVLFSFIGFHFVMIIICNHFLQKKLWHGFIWGLKTIVPFASILSVISIQFWVYPINHRQTMLQLSFCSGIELLSSFIVFTPFVYFINQQSNILNLILRSISLKALQKNRNVKNLICN